jgi:hypothetical protein
MSDYKIDEMKLRQYLLGRLSPPEDEEMEELCFIDERLFNQLQDVETDLIDAYARGQLKAKERREFEAKYLAHPLQRERVKFAELLSQMGASPIPSEASPKATPKRRFDIFRWPFFENYPIWGAVALAALVAGAVIYALVSRHTNENPRVAGLSTDPTPLLSPSPSVSASPTTVSPTISQSPERSVPKMAVWVLKPVTLDSGDSRFFSIPQGVEGVSLQIGLDRDEYKNYRAVIQRARTEDPVWSSDPLSAYTKNGQRLIQVPVPAALFRPGDYRLTLKGIKDDQTEEEVRIYNFNVV